MVDFDLGKQVGPLPLGGWVAVVGGGLAIAYFINRDQSSGSDGGQVPLTERGVGEGGGQILLPDDPVEGIQENEPSTNAQWASRAINWLISRGTNGVTAANAVNKYLAGDELSSSEAALINLVLATFGNPPEGSIPVDVKPGDKEPEKPDKPEIGTRRRIYASSMNNVVKKYRSTKLYGRAYYDAPGAEPAGFRMVRVAVYVNGLLQEVAFVRTTNDGRFNFVLGKNNTTLTPRGRKIRIAFTWEGARDTIWVKVV